MDFRYRDKIVNFNLSRLNLDRAPIYRYALHQLTFFSRNGYPSPRSVPHLQKPIKYIITYNITIFFKQYYYLGLGFPKANRIPLFSPKTTRTYNNNIRPFPLAPSCYSKKVVCSLSCFEKHFLDLALAFRNAQPKSPIPSIVSDCTRLQLPRHRVQCF